GQAICRNKIETMWSCNLSQPWGSNKGTCSYTEKTVPCCADNDCQADQYCNREEGCKNRVTILNCPFGNCCTEGGDYKLQDCGSGLECCTATGATVGECKASCAPPPVLPNVPTTGLPTTGPGTTYPSAPAAPNLLLPVIVIVLLGAAGAGVYYFYYLKPKQVTPIPNKTTPTAGAVCGKCNVPIKKGAKFCAGCGNKL
ncbi:MAG: hypothetical protein QGI60_01645, partial [archaeon]|nr:hypothetical protein [archaeon]